MENLNLFNIIAGMASIISLLISIFALNKVSKIERKSKIGGNVSFKSKGDNSQQAIGDINNPNPQQKKYCQ
ncbi:MAG: hypothetical protein AAFO07_07290 [Bacteroidota bacterium]